MKKLPMIPAPESFSFRMGEWQGYSNNVRSIIETSIECAEEFIQLQHPVIQDHCHAAIRSTLFAYFDTYRTPGKPHYIEPEMTRERAVRLMPRSMMNRIGDKHYLAKMIDEAGLQDVAPKTYYTLEDAVNSGGDPERLMFIKGRAGTRGEQVWCVKHADLHKEEVVKNNHIIQENISNPALFYNRKAVFRFYILIYDKQIFISKHGVVVVHGADYDPSVIDHEIHVQHNGQGSEAVRFPFFKLPYMDMWFEHLKTLIRNLLPILEPVRQRSTRYNYLVIGADGLPCMDEKVRLIEFNTIPSLIKPPMVEPVYAPMFGSMMLLTVTGLNDNTWIKIT